MTKNQAKRNLKAEMKTGLNLDEATKALLAQYPDYSQTILAASLAIEVDAILALADIPLKLI